jgi:hypothetical protein
MRIAFLLLGLCAAPAWAADPLKSDACGASLAALQAARNDPARAAQLDALRGQATRDCLGGTGEARRPSPVAQPPIAVRPPTLEPPASPRPPVPAPPAPPVTIDRPAVITNCDAGGCWDSEGRRLNRAGPVLLGPGGPCVTSGQSVQCP